jgi:hypothetical protein
MNILIACEYSGVVREAFRAKGHNAYSCDLLESDIPSPYHVKCNVLDILNDNWDMMIAFPPCTHLAVSGARWWKDKKEEQSKAVQFVKTLMDSSIDKICIENPIGHLSKAIRKPDQIVHPWMFGDPYSKATCLWLKNLPLLVPTNVVSKGEKVTFSSGKSMPSWYNLSPGPLRGKLRSKTFQGLANAMADQWG